MILEGDAVVRLALHVWLKDSHCDRVIPAERQPPDIRVMETFLSAAQISHWRNRVVVPRVKLYQSPRMT